MDAQNTAAADPYAKMQASTASIAENLRAGTSEIQK
jgi:hypothetical protein